MTILKLDTTTAKLAKVEITKDYQVVSSHESESPLISIKESLNKANLELKSIDSFTANPGPGSYTGIRVGLAVTNALNFSLGKKFAALDPIYG